MSGNVWEWTWDWWDNYDAQKASTLRVFLSGSLRIIRGGGWGSNGAERSRQPHHRFDDADYRQSGCSFPQDSVANEAV